MYAIGSDAVSIMGDTLVVCDEKSHNQSTTMASGTVFVYRYQSGTDTWDLVTQIDNTFGAAGDDMTGFAAAATLLTETQLLVSDDLYGEANRGRAHLYTCGYTDGDTDVYECTHSMFIEPPTDCMPGSCWMGHTFNTDPSDPSMLAMGIVTQRGRNKFNMVSERWTTTVYTLDLDALTYTYITIPNPEGDGYQVPEVAGVVVSGGFMGSILEETGTGESEYNAMYHRNSANEWILDQKITSDICTAGSPVPYCQAGGFGGDMVLSPPDEETGFPTLALYSDSCSQSLDPSGCVVFLTPTPIPGADPETESAYTWGVVGGIESLAPDGSSMGVYMVFPSADTMLTSVSKSADLLGISINASDVVSPVPTSVTTTPEAAEIGRYILDDLTLHFYTESGQVAYDSTATVTLAIPDLQTVMECTPVDGAYLVDSLQLPIDAQVEAGVTLDMTATYFSGTGTQYYASPDSVIVMDTQLPSAYGPTSSATVSPTYLSLPAGTTHTFSTVLHNEYGAVVCDKRDVSLTTSSATGEAHPLAVYDDASCIYSQSLTVSVGDAVYVLTYMDEAGQPAFTQANTLTFSSPNDVTGVSVSPISCQLYMPQRFEVSLSDSEGNKVGGDLVSVYLGWARPTNPSAPLDTEPDTESLTPLSWSAVDSVFCGLTTVQSDEHTALEVYTRDSDSGVYTLVGTVSVDVVEPLAGLATVSGVPGRALSGPLTSSPMEYNVDSSDNTGVAVSSQMLFSLDLDLLQVTSYLVQYYTDKTDEHGYVSFDVLDTEPLWVEYPSDEYDQEAFTMAFDPSTGYLAVCRRADTPGDSGVYIYTVDRETGVLSKELFLTTPKPTYLAGNCAMRDGVLAALEEVYVYAKVDGVWTRTHTIANPFGSPKEGTGLFGASVAIDGDLVSAVDNMPVSCQDKAHKTEVGRTTGVFRLNDDGTSERLDTVCYTEDAKNTGAGIGGSMQLRDGTLVTTSLTLNTVYIHTLREGSDTLQLVRSLVYAPGSDVDPTHSTLGYFTAFAGETVFVSSVYVLEDGAISADFHDTTIALLYSGIKDDPYLGSISVDPTDLDCQTDSVVFTVSLYDASGALLTSDLTSDIAVAWGTTVPDSVTFNPIDSTYACAYGDTSSMTALPSVTPLSVHVTTGGGGLYALSQDNASVQVTVDYGTPTTFVWVDPANAMFPGDARTHGCYFSILDDQGMPMVDPSCRMMDCLGADCDPEDPDAFWEYLSFDLDRGAWTSDIYEHETCLEDVPYTVKVPGSSGVDTDYTLVTTILSYYGTPDTLYMTPREAVLGQDMQISVTSTDSCGLPIPTDNGLSGSWYPTGVRTLADFDVTDSTYHLTLPVGLDQLLYSPVVALTTLGTDYYEAVNVSMGTITRVEIKPDYIVSGPHTTTLMITPYNEFDHVMQGDTSFEVTCVQGDPADGGVTLYADVCMTCSPVGYSVNLEGHWSTADTPFSISVGSLTTPVSSVEVTLIYKAPWWYYALSVMTLLLLSLCGYGVYVHMTRAAKERQGYAPLALGGVGYSDTITESGTESPDTTDVVSIKE
ncbi:hypothetical protein KIPB_000296 [Kipferlia bialata]|uniref:Uncharacterized protein n=1 Tax=Kipferlia bialata TaxID=797122 RepID=A0A9K3CNB5_9EUKA|nr:hypothetical protein KIPB_000296 [Kipferlia bialata]|eukprot:g296.t1